MLESEKAASAETNEAQRTDPDQCSNRDAFERLVYPESDGEATSSAWFDAVKLVASLSSVESLLQNLARERRPQYHDR